MTELLNCPFCGADRTQLYVAKTYDCVKIGCLACSAQFLLANHFGNNKEAVVNAWNTRAKRTCHNTEHMDGCFVCSACGEELEDPRQEPNFVKWCPFCGAKVVD